MTALRADSSKTFVAHWLQLKKDKPFTSSADFLDNPHPELAPNCIIMEIVGTSITLRLEGTDVVNRWGIDETGKNVQFSNEPKVVHSLLRNGESMHTQPCGLRSFMELGVRPNLTLLMEVVILPLAVEEKRPKRLVCHSAMLERGFFNDSSARWQRTHECHWIDIGDGTPTNKPSIPPATNINRNMKD